jgi:hypothetical protein
MPDKNCIKDCCRPAPENISPAIREKNAAVIGSGDPLPTKSHLAGIDPERPYTYRAVFFGAPREYGPNEGWQTVSYKKKGKRARRWQGKEVEVAPEEFDEEYA